MTTDERHENDDALEAILREQFEGPVPDDGFCEQVMERLPSRNRRREWPLVAGIMAGVATCWASLQAAPIAAAGWRDWMSGDLTAPAITLLVVIMGMAILALVWTMQEAGEGDGRLPRAFTR